MTNDDETLVAYREGHELEKITTVARLRAYGVPDAVLTTLVREERATWHTNWGDVELRVVHGDPARLSKCMNCGRAFEVEEGNEGFCSDDCRAQFREALTRRPEGW